ncbi:transglycosylase domain-containing protein [Primorskyibacter aestuariivivens]|uniref:transglycosylase domain-containing protein n=1 Tax=Primorskyibacter aestuariivivens TaxID=1888912 RepID=UPI0023008372|nr:transglycosylase domain-containing protein [Primorskyibacter aestuariivivens]MDA7428308.1 transglycosylase domain-containing protein [Primorskyibacter aestuariivivens]
MSDSGRRKPRLVADKRYSSAKPASKGAGTKKPVRKRRKAPARKPVRRGPIGYIALFVGWILRLFLRIGMTVTAVIALLVAGGVFYYYSTLPPLTDLLDGRARGSVTMLDRNGEVFAWRGDQFGGIVTAETVSPHLKNAVVATEDKRFYRHFGVSPRGVASAIRINLREGRGPLSGHGGSTITQQTAKLLCLGTAYDETKWKSERAYEQDCREGSLWRKIKEATYAMAMEAKYSKDDILTIYLNRAFLGEGARGFEAASQRYFGKSANEVDPAEAAMLAGLLVAPSRYAPTNNLERSQRRAATVVRLMEEQRYLTPDQARQAQANPAELSEAAEAEAGGYFADWVMASGPEFFTRNTTEDVIIRTTLDQRIQAAAEEAMKSVFENKVSKTSKAQAAIVVMSADGAVRGMVGGRKTKVSGVFNRATQAVRQPGSAFKPFVYATAMELGYDPNDMVRDEKYCLNIPGSGEWCPKNYVDKYRGMVTLTEALKDSLNIPAVKISEALGRDLVQKVARDFGIESTLADTPAMALGASESTLIEMVGAYAGILNGGSSVTPYGLVELKLLGDDTPVMDTQGGIGERVIQREAAGKLIYMMEKVVSEGTGRRARLSDRQAAGKTGTSQAARDAWFIGFTADYVAGVWMGYDDNTPLNEVTGGGLPAEIWRETMVRVHEGVPVRPLPIVPPEPKAAPQTQPLPQRGRDPVQDVAETVLEQVLRDLFGSGN